MVAREEIDVIAASQQGGDTVVNITGGLRLILVGVILSALPDGWIAVAPSG